MNVTIPAIGQKWADKDKRLPYRRVIVERADDRFVHYRDNRSLRYRSKTERFLKAFRLCDRDES